MAAAEADGILIARDILVVGGGMAACWAAIAAARSCAVTLLVDKGFVGTSGVTATAGPNHWWVPPGPTRDAAIERRWQASCGLADRAWMAQSIAATWETLPTLAPWYRFGDDGRGGTYYSGVRGPEYLRALRGLALSAGVRILDHHPALELLVRRDGSVAGAAGYARLDRRSWTARAGAVVLATGGCAFRSGLIGSHTNTGDGHLMAAEAGAELSGMEFSNAYSLSPAWCSTRTLPYTAARFFDADGRELDIPPPMSSAAHNRALATAMLVGGVFADLADAPPVLRTVLRCIQPATPLPFERRGVRLFDNRFEVKLFGEGTIRGTGGLRIVGNDCATSVHGLYAAGDVATREPVAGATSGGGAQNSAWALASGLAAGAAAAAEAARDGRRNDERATPAGTVVLRPTSRVGTVDASPLVATVQRHMLAYDRTLWRSEPALAESQVTLDNAWAEMSRDARAANGLDQVGPRETAAMVATARWCIAAALARTESRGMHMRTDVPATLPDQAHRLLVGGLDTVWTRPDAASAAISEAA